MQKLSPHASRPGWRPAPPTPVERRAMQPRNALRNFMTTFRDLATSHNALMVNSECLLRYRTVGRPEVRGTLLRSRIPNVGVGAPCLCRWILDLPPADRS